MLHCWAQNKSATQANNNAVLIFQWGEPSGLQTKTLREASVSEAYAVQSNWALGLFCISIVSFCTQLVLQITVMPCSGQVPVIATVVLHNDSCYHRFFISIPTVPVVYPKF